MEPLTCACGKVRFASRARAGGEAKRIMRLRRKHVDGGGTEISPYRCPHNRHTWHIGHPPMVRNRWRLTLTDD